VTETERYATPGSVEAAIAAAARKAFTADHPSTIQERIRLEYFHRFLSRVFSETDNSDWMLKGGTAMLARVASARTMIDVDLFRRSRTLDTALDDLCVLAAVDLGDFFQFGYTGYSNAVDGNQQTGSTRSSTRSPTRCVRRSRSTTAARRTARRISLILLSLPPPRLWTRRSSVAPWTLKPRVRSLRLPGAFDTPTNWGARYAKLASKVPACADFRTVELARDLMQAFIDPVLQGEATGLTWSPESLAWNCSRTRFRATSVPLMCH
jgi:hypothetical protein